MLPERPCYSDQCPGGRSSPVTPGGEPDASTDSEKGGTYHLRLAKIQQLTPINYHKLAILGRPFQLALGSVVVPPPSPWPLTPKTYMATWAFLKFDM